MKKVLKIIGLVLVLLIVSPLVYSAIKWQTMTDAEKWEALSESAERSLVGKEIKLSGGGYNGTPTLYLRDDNKGFFQYMRGYVPNCKASMRWSYDHKTEMLTISGLYNRNCNLGSFNRAYSISID